MIVVQVVWKKSGYVMHECDIERLLLLHTLVFVKVDNLSKKKKMEWNGMNK